MEKNLRGGTKRKRCLQNQTDDIRGGGKGLVSSSPLSFVRSELSSSKRLKLDTSLDDLSFLLFLSSPVLSSKFCDRSPPSPFVFRRAQEEHDYPILDGRNRGREGIALFLFERRRIFRSNSISESEHLETAKKISRQGNLDETRRFIYVYSIGEREREVARPFSVYRFLVKR